jgi:hypothetical protein
MASGRVVSSWVPTLALEGIKHAVYFDCLHGCGVGQKRRGVQMGGKGGYCDGRVSWYRRVAD